MKTNDETSSNWRTVKTAVLKGNLILHNKNRFGVNRADSDSFCYQLIN